MANALTQKQRGFVADYLTTGNGALAAKKVIVIGNSNRVVMVMVMGNGNGVR
jgi:hypothetical protein